MNRILGLALAGALSVAALPAVAADFPLKAPPPPIWTWTGFYVGVQAGAGWLHTSQTNVVTGLSTFDFQGSGGEIGGTLGWNWQVPGTPWLFGIEGDWSWANLAASTLNNCAAGCNAKVDSFGTIRGRFGHINGPLLAYVTGGWAWAHVKSSSGGASGSDDGTGWTVGAGLEGALGGGWTLKAEYLYVDIGATFAYSVLGIGAAPVVQTVQNDYLRFHILRAGVNYKF